MARRRTMMRSTIIAKYINLFIRISHGIAPHQKDTQSTCQKSHLRCFLPTWTVLGARRDQDRSLSYCLTQTPCTGVSLLDVLV